MSWRTVRRQRRRPTGDGDGEKERTAGDDSQYLHGDHARRCSADDVTTRRKSSGDAVLIAA